MQDGLARENLTVGSLVAQNEISGASASIDNYELGAGAASGTKVSSEYATVTVGSPSAPGNSIQSNIATVGAGSTIWVVFPTAFAAAPKCVATYCDGTVASVAGSPFGAGSVLFTGETASKKIHWICVGSGRV